jgi:uncharacterized protein YndB with AHSA1/START domain
MKQDRNEKQDFTLRFTVDETPQQVFAAINNPRAWWSEAIAGDTDKPGSEFSYHFKDFHRSQLKVVDFVPGRKVTWHVLDNYFSFTKDSTEWKDTNISFEINKKGDHTELLFTHRGLVPEYECYQACADGWTTYVTGSLRSLIETGKGQPNVGDAVTDSEQALS